MSGGYRILEGWIQAKRAAPPPPPDPPRKTYVFFSDEPPVPPAVCAENDTLGLSLKLIRSEFSLPSQVLIVLIGH